MIVSTPKGALIDTVHFTLYNINSVHYTLYHGLATFTEVTFVNVHHAQMSTLAIEVFLWYVSFVLVFNWLFHY